MKKYCEEIVRVCAYCREEIQVVSTNDDHLDYCENCHQIEGKTIELTIEEYEEENK